MEAHLVPTFARIVRALREHELVSIIVPTRVVRTGLERRLGGDGVRFVVARTDWCWCRDNGPVFVGKGNARRIVDWGFDAWGAPWLPHRDDDRVPQLVGRVLGLPVVTRPLVIEGGALEWSGHGVFLGSRDCLTARNPGATVECLADELRLVVGARRVIWLDGRPSDDRLTLGHVDAVARFVAPDTAVVGRVSDRGHPDHRFYERAARRIAEAGLHVLRMPLPASEDGTVCNYMNWYVANGAVLVGTFGDPRADVRAMGAVGSYFPGRQIVGIDVRALWRRGGGIHCVTMQEPA